MTKDEIEKEAEEYSNNWKINKNSDLNFAELVELRAVIYKANKDGAINGYNKANEWHKDLPTEDIRLAIIEIEDCGYLLCEYRNGVWYDNGYGAVCKDWITNSIVRWKEIELPKEIEENAR